MTNNREAEEMFEFSEKRWDLINQMKRRFPRLRNEQIMAYTIPEMERILREKVKQEKARHVIVISSESHVGSIPFVFEAACSCGWSAPSNAFKWTALNVQNHLIAVGIVTDKGRLQNV